MGEVLLTNLFFIITGLAILAVAAFLCVVLYHLLKAVRTAREILERVQASTELLVADVETFRTQVLHGGIIKHLIALLGGMFSSSRPKRRSSRKKNVTSEEA